MEFQNSFCLYTCVIIHSLLQISREGKCALPITRIILTCNTNYRVLSKRVIDLWLREYLTALYHRKL
jgi:predicted transcriptional regulator